MAARSRLLATVFLSLLLLIVAVRGNAGPAGKLRQRPRSQLKSERVVAELPEDLYLHLRSEESQPSAAPDADSDFDDLIWSPGKRGRDGKKLSFSDFYGTRGKKLNPDMFYVSRGRRDAAYGPSEGRPHQVQRFLSASEEMDTSGGSDSRRNRMFQRIRGGTPSRIQTFADSALL